MRYPRRRLFWRIYLFGLFLVCLATLAVVATTILVQPESRYHGRPERLHQVLAAELEPLLGRPEALEAGLRRLAGALERSAAIYDRDGTPLARTGGAPPVPLTAEELAKVGGWHPLHRQSDGWVHAVALGGPDGAYLLVQGAEAGFAGLLIALAAVLLVVALASWPLARAFARPLERLTATAHRLAAGELSARSGLVRGDELGDLSRSLDEMASRLEHRIRAEKELFANLSHEIRTPLARLRVALELLEDVPGDFEETLDRLQGVGADLTELERLVDNVLINSRLDLIGRVPDQHFLQRRPIDLNEVVTGVLERFARYHPEQRLDAEIAGALPVAWVDPAQICRVFDNLLENAVKYNRNATPLRLTAGSDTGRFWFEIEDAGEGVPPEDLEQLFDPFFRSHRCRSRQTGGSGLGLTISKRIVEAHAGRISARLNPAGGMTFRFEIPTLSPSLHA